jgi:DNA repair exonuclease SbcCD ATPase subunit
VTAAKIVGVTLENFGSYERAEYALDGLGLVLVEGRNLDDPRAPSNGAGKSTAFLDGPTWGLFGEAREGVSADDVINDVAGKGCAVTVRLAIPGIGDVTVQRFRKVSSKSGVRLWIGAHVADLADAKREDLRPHERTALDTAETQRMVNDALGLDLEVWRAAVYRAQDDDRRFAELTDAQQKEVLTKVFELDVIDRYRANATIARSVAEGEQRVIQATVGALEAEAAGLRVDDLRAAHAAWQATQVERLAEVDAQLAEIATAGQAARASWGRFQALEAEAAGLRAAPPPVPGLEPLPAAPVRPALPPGPPRPVRPGYTVRPSASYLPPAPVAPVVEGPRGDAQALATQAQAARVRSADFAAQARAVRHAAEATRIRAATIRARRSGRCGECGSELSPEHAEREAARLEAEALAQFAQHPPLAQAAEVAKTEAARLDGEAIAIRDEYEYRRAAAAKAHAAALEAWRRACADAERQEQARHAAEAAADTARWQAEDAAWQRAEAERTAAADAAYSAALAQHQATTTEVQRRNAERTASARGAWESRIAALDAEARALEGAGAELKRLLEQHHARTSARARIAAETSPTLAAIERSEARAREIATLLETERAKLATVEERIRIADFWIDGFGPRGLKSFVLDERIQELTDRTNEWLRILTAGVYWVRFETQSATKAGKITDRFALRVFRHAPGGTRSRTWGQWSGGQKCRIGVAVDLALADAIAARATRAWDLLVLDEVFRGLDAGGRQAMLDALAVLRRSRGTVLVVEHDPEFRASFDRRITVELQNERSRIVGVS